MRRLRVGVVGVGYLGRHHARLLAAMPEVDLVGVVDVSAGRAAAVAAQCATAALDDYRQLVDRVDAVTIAVPTTAHREVAGAFLDRGIATLVEKPMTRTVAEAEELVGLARATGAVLQVGHIERFNPALRALEALPIRPRYISAERLSTYTFRSTDIGVVLDLMIHDLDLILAMIAAPVHSVQAVGLSLFGAHEDVANTWIEFDDGSVANLSASRASYAAVRKMRIWGAEGYASLDFAAGRATRVRPSEPLRRGRVDLDGVDLAQPAAIKEHLFGKVLRVDHLEGQSGEPLALELENFVRAVRGLEP
ncbi:MAG TPA: Gfo/Idh/MocA family oxidoreductase, partial [Isosphaeraceae bacterium]|nr:Gfo/Idh/MocA family oxidoreductase [Isosphaeraceae bacterium]